MPITPVPPSSVDPVAQVVTALEAATATLAAAALTLADKGSWVTSTAYAVGDVVTQAGQRYCCRTGHTSGTFATDLAASKWVSLDAVAAATSARTITAGTGLTGGGDLSADRTLTVAYGTTSGTAAQGNDSRITGALQAANNLSDVAAASARTNLGLGTAATVSSTAGGDLSGTLPSPTVAKVNGVAISGTPAAGYVPIATSSITATWQLLTNVVSKITSYTAASGDVVLADASSSRQVTDGSTTSNSTTLTSATAAFTSADVGKYVSGVTIPSGTKISSVTNGTTAVMSAAAVAYTGSVTSSLTVSIGGFPVTLPSPVLNGAVTVKKIDSTSGPIGVVPPSGTIDGASTVWISLQYDSRGFLSDGTNWFQV